MNDTAANIDSQCRSIKGCDLQSQAKTIMFKIFEYFKKEKNEGRWDTPNLYVSLAEASGISKSSLQRIVKEGNSLNEEESFSSPRKKVSRKSPVTDLEPFKEDIIRRSVYTFDKIYHQRPTVGSVFKVLQQEPGYEINGSISSFRKILKKLGFQWKKSADNKKLLMESFDVRKKRTQFLKKMQQYREDNRPIVYTDETYIHSSHTVPLSWSDSSSNCLVNPMTKGQRLIIVHAGSKEGFIKNAMLIFKSGQKSGDFHDDMNYENYMKWLKIKLIPNLPEQSVLVVDNASYHNVAIEPVPNSSWRKQEMQNWLDARHIFYAAKYTKPELYDIIKKHKSGQKAYAIDKLLMDHGHNILRLPPYHPELNPIERIWAFVKNRVAIKNTTFKLADVKELAETELNNLEDTLWAKACNSSQRREEEYMQFETHIDELTDQFIIRLDESSEDDFSDDDTEM